jgi:protein-disulfide isomerase
MAGWRDAAIAGVLGAVVGAGAVIVAQQTGGGHDRAAIGRIVHDYILANPEIIPEANQVLQDRQYAKLIAEHRRMIERPFGGAWAGASDGDVTLVEFTDYACGFCRANLPVVTRLLEEDPKLKVVYRELPIISPASAEAAKVALAAATPERYGSFRHALYDAGAPTPENIASAAARAMIDPAAGNSAAVSDEINGNLALARSLQIGGTPSFVIGDRLIAGAVGYDALKQAIAEARKKRG